MSISPLVKLSIISFIYITGAGAAWYVLPLHFSDISESLLIVGILIALPQIANIIFDIPIGRLCDSFSRKSIILLGFFPVSFIAVFFATHSVYLAAFAMFVYGFFYSFEAVGTMAYVMKISSREKRGKYFGIFESLSQGGWVVGALFIAAILTYVDSSFAFYIFALASLTASLISLKWLKDDNDNKLGITKVFSQLKRHFRDSMKSTLKLKKVNIGIFALVFVNFLIGFWGFVIWLVEPLLSKVEYSNLFAGSLIIAFAELPFVVFALAGGLLSDVIGKKIVIMASLILSFFSIVWFSLTTNSYLLLILPFFASMGFALTLPAAEALLTDMSPKNSQGLISGLQNIMYGLAGVLAPIVSGFLGSDSLRLPLLYTGLLVGVSIIPIWLLVKQRETYATAG